SDPSLDKLVTVAVPTPGGQIVGADTFTSEGSAGYVKGSSDFSFYVQYNKSLRNPQGSAEITVKSFFDRNGKETPGVPHYYKLKSNSISVLATTDPTAEFSAKANISEIVGGVAQSIEGNCTMQLSMYDGRDNPSVTTDKIDRLAVTVYRSNGGIWYSSRWDGTKTILRDVDPKDLISVTGTGGSTTTLAAKTTTQSFSADNPTVKPAASNLLEIYPNPIADQATIRFRSTEGGKAQVYIYNSLGGLVSTLYNAEIEGNRDYSVKLTREDLPNGVYFCHLIINGKVENKRITIER
ncbi:hypothetical protein SAMN00120144_4264, partial [Hymenobacter roseosalivarius DSM 11622]